MISLQLCMVCTSLADHCRERARVCVSTAHTADLTNRPPVCFTPSHVLERAQCADGSPAPQSWLFNQLFNNDVDKQGRTIPLAGLPAVSTQKVATG
jgi:hypothetical protein